MNSPSVTVNAEDMNELYKLAKTKYTTGMFAEFSKIRETKLVSDFEIRVENEAFPVHRFILIAASKYFKAMFMSEMKEAEQKFVEMKGVDVEGIKYCLQFIYTREVDLPTAPVESILQASHLIQINDLTDLCFGYLRLNISTENCISTLKLSQFYNRNDVKNIADQYILDHWKEVVLTDDFPTLNHEDLISYLEKSKVDYTSSWKAVVRWLADKDNITDGLVLQLMKKVEIENFPFEFLLKTVLDDPLVQRYQKAHDEVLNKLFSNLDQLKQNLSLDTVFPLRKLTKTNAIPNIEDYLNLITEFIGNNFEHLSQKEEIGNLDEKEIVHLFKSRNGYFAERAKFIAAVTWTRKDHRNRKKSFPKLFKLIKLPSLSPDFIQQNIRSEPLVKESAECLNHILENPAPDTPYIACLYKATEEIKVFNLSNNQWFHLAKVPKSNRLNIVSVENVLYLLHEKNLLVLQEDGTWLKKSVMPRYPNRVVSFQNRVYDVDNDAMSCYDPMQNTSDITLPGCRLGDGFCVAASDEFIYAMGGRGTEKFAKKFDPRTRTWQEISPMCNKRAYALTEVLDGKVFVMGGYCRKPLDDVELYDPNQNQWSRVASLSHPRFLFSSCVVNNKLYAVGGARDAYDKRLDPDSIETYNQVLGKWEIVFEMEKSNEAIYCCLLKL